MKRTFVVRPGEDGDEILTNAFTALGALDRERAWDIDISPHTDRWTTRQRNALHALLRDLSREYEAAYGDSIPMEAFRRYYKQLMLGEVAKELPNGRIIDVEKSLSVAGKRGTMDLITFILQHSASELGIQLQEPGEYAAWKAEQRG